MTRSQRLAVRFLLALLAGAICAAGQTPVAAQFNEVPVPSGPYELVTGNPVWLSSPQQRAQALALLDEARQQFTMLTSAFVPFVLNLDYVASGTAPVEGSGVMQEQWFLGNAWVWQSTLGSVSVDRYGARGGVFSTTGTAPVPMRTHMVRAALFWPIHYSTDARSSFRAAGATFNGKPVTCVLLSPTAYRGPPNGRGWREAEFCIDPASGLLLTWSEAPGIYMVDDYSPSITYQGHTLPGQITCYEGTQQVLQISIAGISAPETLDPASVLPPPTAGRSYQLGFPTQVALNETGKPPSPDITITPVIVHATLSPTGTVNEYELLPGPLSDGPQAAHALDILTSRTWPRGPGQRETFFEFDFVVP